MQERLFKEIPIDMYNTFWRSKECI